TAWTCGYDVCLLEECGGMRRQLSCSSYCECRRLARRLRQRAALPPWCLPENWTCRTPVPRSEVWICSPLSVHGILPYLMVRNCPRDRLRRSRHPDADRWDVRCLLRGAALDGMLEQVEPHASP